MMSKTTDAIATDKPIKNSKNHSNKKPSPLPLVLAILCIIAGVFAYHLLPNYVKGASYILQILVLFLGLGLGAVIAITSPQGKLFIKFGKDSYKEVKKVVWPTKDETIKMTLVVFTFVFVMALILWLSDLIIGWLLYVQFFGWS